MKNISLLLFLMYQRITLLQTYKHIKILYIDCKMSFTHKYILHYQAISSNSHVKYELHTSTTFLILLQSVLVGRRFKKKHLIVFDAPIHTTGFINLSL
jgi:hypothetical protein